MAASFQQSRCHVFTRVAAWSVAQTQLSSWKVVRGGQFGLRLTLERSQRASRWANHTITRQQSIDYKIYRIEIQDIVALHLLCSFQRLVFSRCREMRAKDIHTHRHTHTHTTTTTVCLWGSTHWGIIIVTHTLPRKPAVMVYWLCHSQSQTWCYTACMQITQPFWFFSHVMAELHSLQSNMSM